MTRSPSQIIARSQRLFGEQEQATNRPRNADPVRTTPATQVAAVVREVLADKLRWQRVRWKTTAPLVAEAFGEIEDGYPLETTPIEAYRPFIYSAAALSANYFPCLASKRNGAWILTPARKLHGSVLDVGQMNEAYTAVVDLCPRVDFVPWPVKHGNVTYLGLVSRKMTQTRNADLAAPLCEDRPLGFRDWVFASWNLNLITGALQVTIKSEGTRCIGGFCPSAAPDRPSGFGAALRGVLRGWIMIFSSGTECPPSFVAGQYVAGETDACGPYGPPLYPDASCGHNTDLDNICPYCHLTPLAIDCTIERGGCSNTSIDDECVCHAGEFGTGVASRQPSGFMPGARFTSNVIPDVYGRTGQFFAQSSDGIGLVIYSLSPVYPIMVDPLWPDPRTVRDGLCCPWLCRAMIHNEKQAWRIWCNEIIKSQDGNADQNVPKPLPFSFAQDQRICNVHFAFGSHLSINRDCFQLHDQNCFTVNPDHETWGHHVESDPKHVAYRDMIADLGVYLGEATIAPSPTFRHRHASVRKFMNDVLRGVGRVVGPDPNTPIMNLTHASHYARYNEASLNLWTGVKAWGCPPTIETGEDMRRLIAKTNPDTGVITTALWTVHVRMRDTTCIWPAFVLLSSVEATLRLSSEPNVYLDPPRTAYYAQFRLVATLSLYFQGNPVCGGIRREPTAGPCEPRFVLASGDVPIDRQLAYALDEGSDYVPLTIEWRGILGPRPWSRKFDARSVGGCIGWTNICNEGDLPAGGVLDQGLEIPGEPNDTADGDPPQRFSGRVIVTTTREIDC